MEHTIEIDPDDLYEDVSLCILEGHDVCYCQDHNACIAQWNEHDEGNHADCHPAVCDKDFIGW